MDFYEGYRACVRGKIAGYAMLDSQAPAAVRASAAGKAARYFRFALDKLAKPSAAAPLILIGGGIATGKSTLAEVLGRRLAVPVLDSDRTRKRMAGHDPLTPCPDPPWSGLYAPENTARVYAELRRRAGVILASGRPVIVDASFGSRAERDAFRSLAGSRGSPVRYFECRAPDDVVAGRLGSRALGPSISDGRAALTETLRSVREDDAEACIIGTMAPLEACLGRIQANLPDFPGTTVR